MTDGEVAAAPAKVTGGEVAAAPAKVTGGEVAAAPAKVTRSKAAGKRRIIVGEDAMGKKAKSLVKKVEVEVVSKTKVKGIKNKSIIDLAFDEADMKKPGTNIKKKAKGHGRSPP